jgi:hypothetical protein
VRHGSVSNIVNAWPIRLGHRRCPARLPKETHRMRRPPEPVRGSNPLGRAQSFLPMAARLEPRSRGTGRAPRRTPSERRTSPSRAGGAQCLQSDRSRSNVHADRALVLASPADRHRSQRWERCPRRRGQGGDRKVGSSGDDLDRQQRSATVTSVAAASVTPATVTPAGSADVTAATPNVSAAPNVTSAARPTPGRTHAPVARGRRPAQIAGCVSIPGRPIAIGGDRAVQ